MVNLMLLPLRRRRYPWWLWWVIAFTLLVGMGLREPMPADEPRFVLAARTMVDSGEWLFPQRGDTLYAEKPPMFMWLQAASYLLVRDWSIAFLLPSLLAAGLTLLLTGDLAARLWGRRAAQFAVLALAVCVQFGLQAKRAQIDMVLVGMTTLSLWALVRYLLEQPRGTLLALGCFAAGLGTVTKGVGFLPLLLLLPWAWVCRRSTHALPIHPRWHVWLGVGAFLAGVGVWLVPMLGVALSSGDPALQAYAREMLFKQTGTRYAAAWGHIRPAWYYLQVMLTLWMPAPLLAPWVVPAWWRRLRRSDPRQVLLLGWAALVLVFFTISPGKREMYIFPMLPALCVAVAPLLPGLLRRSAVRRVLWAWAALLALLLLGLGSWLQLASSARLQALVMRHGIEPERIGAISAGLLALGALAGMGLAWAFWKARAHPERAVLGMTAVLWTAWGLCVMPALSPESSAQSIMRRVGQHIGAEAELGLLGWREQHLLQADRRAEVFGFKRTWAEQWQPAQSWLRANPTRRWLFLRREAVGACLDPAQIVDMGRSNRRAWVLAPGTALIAGCEMALKADATDVPSAAPD